MQNTQIKDMMLEVRREYEQRQGYEIDDGCRLSHYVQDRVALANAFRPYSTFARIGEVFGKDHATIIHYPKEHEPMMNTYPSYLVKYQLALDLTHKIAQRMALAPQIKIGRDRNLHNELRTIKRTIKNLKLFQQKIEITLGINEEDS